MANPVTDLLEHINAEVSKLSTVGLKRLTEVLDHAEIELTKALGEWSALGKGDDRFTPQMYRNAVVQIRGALENIRGPMAEGVAQALRHGGTMAAHLATSHLITQVTTWSSMFEGSIRPIAIEAASVLAEGKKLVWPKFANSASRYAGQVGDDIRKQLAIGVVKGETIDQLTDRLAKLGGPKGMVYTQGRPGSPRAKAEYIAEGLFTRYRHFAERLAVTETVNAYNSFAMVGMDELEAEDPGYFKRWDAAIDKRTCEQCAKYDDLVVPLNKKFPRGLDHPPLHPRCRCACVVWRKEWDESHHKDDLVGETVKGKHPESVPAIPHRIDLPKQKAEEKAKKEAKPKTPKESKDKTVSVVKDATPLSEAEFKQYQEKYINDIYKQKKSKDTNDQLDAMKFYSGDGYVDINDGLRGKMPKEFAKMAKDLEKAVSLSKAPRDLQVYRGVVGEFADHMKANFKVGTVFSDKGFSSTSADPAKTFGQGVKISINVPKGYAAAPIKSDNSSEIELLLQTNTKFRVDKVEEIVTPRKPTYSDKRTEIRVTHFSVTVVN